SPESWYAMFEVGLREIEFLSCFGNFLADCFCVEHLVKLFFDATKVLAPLVAGLFCAATIGCFCPTFGCFPTTIWGKDACKLSVFSQYAFVSSKSMQGTNLLTEIPHL
ncbi:MAG TPA: hypothetical protein VK168_02935, partial [Saprospiraceae bacterium]|nr:hypothetical protein [Saprospiraceae bacterium]